ncbi:hypothetical protein [Actinacidiphila oryziradicis]|uniref:Uncharacterized protein n=1 Tax=Actinacidiphila oryziradicis TaxID=2571141 RepID=A0A4U0SJ90_9ACTN|nr:hypothetical protein [Actinacidiphila oryziradicis]TKA09672.1 hypothetical protein FCI23_21390 [Actinacidiphila oryziradicis]
MTYGAPYEGGSREPVRPRMTMRVYRVSRGSGAVTEELGRVSVMADDRLAPMMSGQFPPCRCPLHRLSADAAGHA